MAYVLAAVFADTPSATIAAGMLQNHGIEAVVEPNAMASLYPMPDSQMTAIRLMVPSEQLAEARDLLHQHGDI